MDPLAFDPDVWLETVAADRRISGFSFMLAWTIARALRRGAWPRSLSALARDAHRDRRTLQRALWPLEHCGFLRRVQVNGCTARIDIMINGRTVL